MQWRVHARVVHTVDGKLTIAELPTFVLETGFKVGYNLDRLFAVATQIVDPHGVAYHLKISAYCDETTEEAIFEKGV